MGSVCYITAFYPKEHGLDIFLDTVSNIPMIESRKESGLLVIGLKDLKEYMNHWYAPQDFVALHPQLFSKLESSEKDGAMVALFNIRRGDREAERAWNGLGLIPLLTIEITD